MPYRFLDDIAIADVAFEAEGSSLGELLEAAALAVTNTMVRDPAQVEPREAREIKLTSGDVETLLFNFLQELIFYKDAEQLLFGRFDIDVGRTVEGDYELEARAFGERLDMSRHELLADVKAVTMHMFEVTRVAGKWRARVILDV